MPDVNILPIIEADVIWAVLPCTAALSLSQPAETVLRTPFNYYPKDANCVLAKYLKLCLDWYESIIF